MTIKSDLYFSSPVYRDERPEFLEIVNKVSDIAINDSKLRDEESELLNKKNKLGNEVYNKIKDHGWSYQSGPLLNFNELDSFIKYLGNNSYEILDSQGFDLKNYSLVLDELWVQEFSKNGGGHHHTHIHYNNHISGFYFLKCSDKTSYPVFEDPRQAAMMSKLPVKKESDFSLGQSNIHYKPMPGTVLFFNSYLPHRFEVDDGIDDFRFVHFNFQAVKKQYIGEKR